MKTMGSQIRKLLSAETISIQRLNSLRIIDGIKPTDRFHPISEQSSYIVIKETRGEHPGRILMFPWHLVAEPLEEFGYGDDRELRVSLREPCTITEPPSGFLL